MHIVHEGMLADVETEEGPEGIRAFGQKIPGWRVAGKTGTAEVENRKWSRSRESLQDPWFVFVRSGRKLQIRAMSSPPSKAALPAVGKPCAPDRA